MSSSTAGLVSLVGAGPGDPELLTLKGQRRLKQADIVLYDQLVSRAILLMCPSDCELVHRSTVGNGQQAELNDFLVRQGLLGKRVVRLKGGDPFVFGRGAEEAQALAAAGVPFEVVPGVSSGIAVPAYAGIPLTHREHASNVTFVTGHEDPTKPDSMIQWDRVVRTGGTLVVFMGVRRLEAVVQTLLDKGVAADTPCAVIQWGTTPKQKTVEATVSTVVSAVQSAKLTHPALTVIGNVVRYRNSLSWFDRRPLWGRRVLVTRAARQAGALVEGLREFGAGVLTLPVLEFQPPTNPSLLSDAIQRLAKGQYDWVVLTSANAVSRLHDAIGSEGFDNRIFGGSRIACVGPATAAALADYGISVDLLPEDFQSEGILRALSRTARISDARVLLPRAEVGRATLPEGLTEIGAQVDVVPVYRTTMPETAPDVAQSHVELSDTITFTSPSSVTNLLHMLGPSGKDLLRSRTLAAIGPITSGALLRQGLDASIVADAFTVDSLVAAIVNHAESLE